jgi:two-component system response regulator HydG
MNQARMRVLVTEDDAERAAWLRRLLEQHGHEVRFADDGRTTELLCHVWRPDLVLLDLFLSDIDGLTVLRRLKERHDGPHVIIVTAGATVSLAVEALTEGAMSLIEKPIDVDRLIRLLDRVQNERREAAPSRTDQPVEQLGGILTRDPAMRSLFEMIRTTAPTSVNVLIQGENGAGKELVASALHELSSCADGPFVKVNCAAIASELLESELFGHTRGAFTDAIADKKGLFELAHDGSILLDEVGEMPLALQVKLLRVLQEREFRPVGGTRAIRANFRLICATNIDSHQAVADGRLRQDLYFRLNTIVLEVPPLRERVGDVSLLATHFLGRLAATYRRNLRGFEDPAMRLLERHTWPGNVRELEHVIERAVSLARGEYVTLADLPNTLRDRDLRRRSDLSVPAGCTLDEVERLAILQTLELTSWNKRAAATILGIHRPTLYSKLRKYGLSRPDDRFRRDELTRRAG